MSDEAKILPWERRVRLITTNEGKFMHVGDVANALTDDNFVQHCMHMLKIGHDQGHSHTECCRRMIGCAVMILSGDESWARAKRLEKEGGA